MTTSRLRRISAAIALAFPLSVHPVLAGTFESDPQNRNHPDAAKPSGTYSGFFHISQAVLSADQNEPATAQDPRQPKESGQTTLSDNTAIDIAAPPTGQAVAQYDQALVREIQRLLSEQGFNAGPPDGIMGPTTAKAIVAYQESVGLRVDGKPSRKLLEQLRNPAGNGSAEETPKVQETDDPQSAAAALGYEPNPYAVPGLPLTGTTWRFADESGSKFMLEFAPDGAVKGVLYEKFWTWQQAGKEVVISYDNGMGLKVSRTGRMSHAASMSGRAQPSRGEAWSWTAKRISPPVPDAAPAETAQPHPPEPYAEQPGPADSSDPVEAAPADSGETETLVASDTQPVSDIETNSPTPETKPDEVVQTEQPAPEPPTIPDAVVQPQAPATSDFENNDQAPSGDVIEQTERKPRVYGENNPDGRIVIRAVENSWLEVTDTEDEILFSRVLKRGDSYRAPIGQGATFVIGNAGGLEITVDGQPAPALGPVGVVRRGVALDPELLKSGAAWPPTRDNTAPLPQPEPYAEQPGPADSSDQVEVTPADSGETETLVAPDTQPVSDIETNSPPPETKPDEVVQTEQPAPEPPTVPHAVAQPKAPATSDFENNDQAPSGDVIEQTERKPRVYGENNPDGRIVIRAVENSWVEVTDTEGKILFSRVLKRGDSYRAPARQGATFVTGNAGGLEIIIDGQPAPALGPVGVVRRGVALDPELLKSGAAWPPAPGDKVRP